MLATLIASVFAVLSLLHVYWAFGGHIGLAAAVPERATHDARSGRPRRVKIFQPSRSATLLVAGALAGMGALVALRAGLFGAAVTHWSVQVLLSALAVVFLVRAVGDFDLLGFFKRANDSAFAFWDSVLYSPLCVALGAGLASVAWPRTV
ncbi:MAG: DUF3995 domain-containing protein [Burkholderiaceae bacterium]